MIVEDGIDEEDEKQGSKRDGKCQHRADHSDGGCTISKWKT